MLEEGATGHFKGNMPTVSGEYDFEHYKVRLEWQIEVTKRAVKQTFETTKVRSSDAGSVRKTNDKNCRTV